MVVAFTQLGFETFLFGKEDVFDAIICFKKGHTKALELTVLCVSLIMCRLKLRHLTSSSGIPFKTQNNDNKQYTKVSLKYNGKLFCF